MESPLARGLFLELNLILVLPLHRLLLLLFPFLELFWSRESLLFSRPLFIRSFSVSGKKSTTERAKDEDSRDSKVRVGALIHSLSLAHRTKKSFISEAFFERENSPSFLEAGRDRKGLRNTLPFSVLRYSSTSPRPHCFNIRNL